MITHIVIFWVDKPYGDNRKQLLEGARALIPQIPGVKQFHAGIPIPSPRAVVDESFAVGMSMSFEDQTTADNYQSHPLHVEFAEKYVRPLCRRMLVYDWT